MDCQHAVCSIHYIVACVFYSCKHRVVTIALSYETSPVIRFYYHSKPSKFERNKSFHSPDNYCNRLENYTMYILSGNLQKIVNKDQEKVKLL